MNGLALKALVAFVALPGMVAFAVPLLLIAPPTALNVPVALVTLAPGVLILLRCVRDFYVSGRGTLAPWAPPRQLVITGLYRYTRNPMYVGVLLILAAWAACFRSLPLAVYAFAVAVAFHIRVVVGEEPTLARSFGEEWDRYRQQVPRWIGVTSLFRLRSFLIR